MSSGDFRNPPFNVDDAAEGVDEEPRPVWELDRLRPDGGAYERELTGRAPKQNDVKPKRGGAGAPKDWTETSPTRTLPASKVAGSRCVNGRFLGSATKAPQDAPDDPIELAELRSADPAVRNAAKDLRPTEPVAPSVESQAVYGDGSLNKPFRQQISSKILNGGGSADLETVFGFAEVATINSGSRYVVTSKLLPGGNAWGSVHYNVNEVSTSTGGGTGVDPGRIVGFEPR